MKISALKMNNLNTSAGVKNLALILLCLGCAVFIYSLFGRFVHIDDAYIGEPSYWLAKNGFVRAEIFRGWEHAEEQLLWTHKIYTLTVALFIRLFGYGVTQVKAVSLVYFAGLAVLWWKIAKDAKFSSTQILLFFVLFVFNSYLFEKAFVARPEIAVCFWATVTFLFLTRGLKLLNGSDNCWSGCWTFCLAGLAAGLSIGNHLNGLIVAGAGCVLLLWHRQFKWFFVFGVIASLGLGSYFWDIRNAADLNLMWRQFSNAQDMRQGQFQILHYLWNLLNELQRFLHSIREISISLFIFSAIITCRKKLWQEHRDLMIFTFSMVFFLALIAHGKTSKYMTLYMPFLIFLGAAFALELRGRAQKIVIGFLALYLVFQANQNWTIARNKDIQLSGYRELTRDLPPESHVLAHVTATFVVTGHWWFQSFQAYQALYENGLMQRTSSDLQQKIQEFEIDAMIVDRESAAWYGVSGDTWGGLRKIREVPAAGLVLYLK